MTPVYFLLFFLFSICIHLFLLVSYIFHYSDLLLSAYRSDLQTEYDYIIVGSGTAGSLIAHRLDTETNYTFVVLEAGSRGNFLFEIPVLGPLLHNSIYDWKYETTPQGHACLAMENNRCKLTQGKIFGGSAKLNNMIHIRGNMSTYVDWFHGQFDEHYLKREFDFVDKNFFHLNDLQYESDLVNAVLNGAKELKSDQFDFKKVKFTQKLGKRWTTSDNIKHRKLVFTNVFVESVLIKEKRAYGVRILLLDKSLNIFAKKGVILSAGTYNTPKILQLSGIGPSGLLKSLDIPVIQNLPVGNNLQDHVATGIDLIMFNKPISISPLDIFNPFSIIQYFINGRGPLTSPGCEVVGFSSNKNGTQDLQFMVLPVGISSDKGSHLRKLLGIKDQIWNDYFSKTFNKHTATILPVVLSPKSKGKVYVTSKNPKISPNIDPQYLSSEEDINVLVKGLKFIKKLTETSAMRNIGAELNSIPFPGCLIYKIFSESYWKCYIKQITLTTYHPVGTCAMGLPESNNSVIDTSFRVLGLQNLYVVDGSVLPSLPSSNINAPIAMMASIFFNTIIKTKENEYCHLTNNDLLHEYIFRTCVNK